MIATETDRGLFIGALAAAGYQVLAIDPMSTSRYRQRYSISGARFDPGDAFVLAELARTDVATTIASSGACWAGHRGALAALERRT